jgi:hypothetical protein
MSDSVHSFSRAGKLVFPVVLLTILAAILFGSFSLILPLHQWTVWRVPALIAAGGGVAVLTAWPFGSSVRPWILDGLAAVMGLTSAIPAIGVTLLIAYGISLQIAEHKGSGESFMYQMTKPIILWQLLYFAIIPAVPGAVGLWIARRRLREARRVSLAGVAARFSTLGLALSAMIGAMVAVAALCRRVMWP